MSTTTNPLDNTFRRAVHTFMKWDSYQDPRFETTIFGTFFVTQVDISMVKEFRLQEFREAVTEEIRGSMPAFQMHTLRVRYDSAFPSLSVKWSPIPFVATPRLASSSSKKRARDPVEDDEGDRKENSKRLVYPLGISVPDVQKLQDKLCLPIQHHKALFETLVCIRTFQGPVTPQDMKLQVGRETPQDMKLQVGRERALPRRVNILVDGIQQCQESELRQLAETIEIQGRWRGIITDCILPRERKIRVSIEVY